MRALGIAKLTLAASLATTLALTAHSPVHAGDTPSKMPPDRGSSNEEAIGVGTGAVIGGVAGGPIGALAGMLIGSLVGDSLNKDDHMERLHSDATEAHNKAGRLAARLEKVQSSNSELRKERERLEARLASVQEGADKLAGSLAMDVLFRTESARLEPIAEKRIRQLAALMQAFPELHLRLDGHADKRGSDDYNRDLAAARAETVQQALVAKGVDTARIHTVTHGERRADAPTSDPEGMALDRRVGATATDDPRTGRTADSRR